MSTGPPPDLRAGLGGQPGPRIGQGAHHNSGSLIPSPQDCAPHPQQTGTCWGKGPAWVWGPWPRLSTGVSPGVDGQVEEEVQRLRSRVDLLEQVRPWLGPFCPLG